MPRNKQKQIDEVANFANVFETPFEMKGKWRKTYFNAPKNSPLILELGCGGGEYTLALAEKFKDKNFIGIDKKGDRIWRAAKKALGAEFATGTESKFTDKSMRNIAFVRVLVEKIGQCFAENEVDEIWVTFPDPHSKPCRANKHLTSKRFLEIYKKILKPKGKIHLKTDNDHIFDFTLETLKSLKIEPEEVVLDVHNMKEMPEILKIKTYYEKKFSDLGAKIKYLKFSFSKKTETFMVF